jgi:hypothetical protein
MDMGSSVDVSVGKPTLSPFGADTTLQRRIPDDDLAWRAHAARVQSW